MTFEYLSRIADKELSERLARAGAVVIRGAKWCGKTETAKQQAASVLYLQDPDNYENNMLAAQTKPSLLLRGDQPRLIDEWQDAPQLWDAVRFAVDQEHGTGHYILTGSATPGASPKHSGAGRFSIMTMRPMSLYESRDSSGDVSLATLFDSPQTIEGETSLDVEDMARLVCRGGWPEAVLANSDTAFEMSRDYLRIVADTDINKVDGVQRSPRHALFIMEAYARSVSTRSTVENLRGLLKARKSELSRATVDAYIAALRKLYVFEDVPAWKPSLRDRTRITSTPTRHFVDPSLAAAALQATPGILLQDMPTLGMLFESLCMRDLRIYAESLGGNVYHYHDDAGREADAVVVLGDGRWGLVEVKMGSVGMEQGASNLVALAAKVNQDVMGTPSFLMVIAPVQYAYVRADGVAVVPLSCLAP